MGESAKRAWAALMIVAAVGCGSSGGPRSTAGGSGGTDDLGGAGGESGSGGTSAPTPDAHAPGAPAPLDSATIADVAAPDRATMPTGLPDAGHAADTGPVGAGALDNYVFSIQCPGNGTDSQCNVPDAQRLKTSAPIAFGGDPGTTYRVKVHFCGPVEGRKYSGCAKTPEPNDSLLCMDGTPVPMSGGDQFVDTYPTYELKVSAPAHSYFVNSKDLRDTLMKIDYDAELEIRGGATLTFSTTSRGEITFTSRQLSPAITCPGVPGLTQPFNGQFVHVKVLSITPSR